MKSKSINDITLFRYLFNLDICRKVFLIGVITMVVVSTQTERTQ